MGRRRKKQAAPAGATWALCIARPVKSKRIRSRDFARAWKIDLGALKWFSACHRSVLAAWRIRDAMLYQQLSATVSDSICTRARPARYGSNRFHAAPDSMSNARAVLYRIALAVRLGDAAAGRHAAGEPDVAADGRTAADGDAAEYRGAGVDHNVVLDDGVARQTLLQDPGLSGRKAIGAERHCLIEPHAFADHSGLADHHAGAVSDEETAAYLGAGMNVDAGVGMGDLGEHARDQRHAGAVEMMGDAVMNDGEHARITQQHFVDAVRRRVAVVGRHHVGVEQPPQRRPGRGEILP